MRRIRVVALLGLARRGAAYPYYDPVFYEAEVGSRTSKPVPLPMMQAVEVARRHAEVSVVMLGTDDVRKQWYDSGDLVRAFREFVGEDIPLEFQLVPSGAADPARPEGTTTSAEFVRRLLPCLQRAPLDNPAERDWAVADEVIFDITNGFRAQSVLATTAVVAAVENALREGREPALRVQYGAFDQKQHNVVPIWDLTGMVTQQAWVRAIDNLVSSARADAFDLLCRELAAERIGRNYHDQNLRQERKALFALGRAAKTLADDLVCARIPAVLTQSARDFLHRLAAAKALIAAHAPATSDPLEGLARLAQPLCCEQVVSVAGLRAQLALAEACLKTERYAVATSILREMLVCAWHLETCGDAAPWQPGANHAAGEWSWGAVEAELRNAVQRRQFHPSDEGSPTRQDRIGRAFEAMADLRNDVQHAGMRAQPLRSSQVRAQVQTKLSACEALVADLYPEAPRRQ